MFARTHTDTGIPRQTNRQTDRQTDRQTHTNTHRNTEQKQTNTRVDLVSRRTLGRRRQRQGACRGLLVNPQRAQGLAAPGTAPRPRRPAPRLHTPRHRLRMGREAWCEEVSA
eukprot:1181880-Rhodomonas_salina.1